MKLIIILSILVISQAAVIKEDGNENNCGGVEINGVHHREEVLKENMDRPYLLTVDRSKDVLYFSYNVVENSDNFISARLNLKTEEFKTIDDVPNGFAQTVDEATNDVYIGGSDGLYKYDYSTHKSEAIGEKGSDIWNVFFKDVLYFSVFPSQFLYTLSYGEVSRFKDLQDTKVDHFVIDSNDVMYFTNATGFYGQRKGTSTATVYKEQERTDNGIRGIAIDTRGKVHICLQTGIFVLNTDTNSLDSVLQIDDAFGLAFDSSNNIIYSDATRLVRLIPENSC
ncbi:ommochrome-binding protein [Amyelois transitella]|uniref:ommochrome-binding protein n=1 Tax=Amyelois transitella TaxID=680683 RepID=UPI00067AA726|nr:ommochrome-binding protein [Amyelois transitella]XP_013194809.1 ommochrome-binding protein [Amyelois transitella]